MTKKDSDFDSSYDSKCVIGTETKIKGTISSSEDVTINGIIDGDVDVKAKIYVGQRGYIKGKIKAIDVFVEGKIEGILKIENRIEMMDSSYVMADLECKTLAVADGAFFEGKVQMETIEKVKTITSSD